jgi:hypothetical protein
MEGRKMEKVKQRLKVGEVKVHKNLAVAPLLGKDSGLDYLVFDEAVNQGLSVRETGEVPTLHFKNETDKEVLILQGEYVTGGKQNRMVATNVYMAKGFDGPVPVNCVEQSRWSGNERGGFTSGNRRAPASVSLMASVGQGEVWGEVRRMTESLGTHTSTGDMGASYAQRESDLAEYLSNFEFQEGAVGVIAAMQRGKHRVYVADVFDQTATLQKNYKKLLESYAIEALSYKAIGSQAKSDMQAFLKVAGDTPYHKRQPVSLGDDLKTAAGAVTGFALVYQETPLYVNLASNFMPQTQGPGADNFDPAQTMIFERPVRTGMSRRFFR